MDHRIHYPPGGPPGPPTSLPPRALPPGHPDDRDRSISSSGPPKRSGVGARTPPNVDIYSQQQQHIHPGIPYKDVSRSPEERMPGPAGSYRPPPPHPSHPTQQPQRHESVPQSNAIHPASGRSPFMPHRTSTPETHQRVSSGHNSFRGPPPPPPPPQESMMQQSLQHQHAQHSQQQHRGMPPPSSPHHSSLAPPPQAPQRPQPSHHHPSGPPPSFGQGPPSGPRRDLPSLSSLSSRPSMSISSMLGSSDPPALPSHASHPSPISTHSMPPSSRPSEFSPLKRPYTPDLNGVSGADRDKQVNSTSASPSTGNAPLPSFTNPKTSRATPHDHVYRAHQPLQYHSLGHPREREHQQVEIMGPQGPPQRPMSQPVTNSQSISSVLQEEPPQRPQLGSSDSYQRMRKYEREWEEHQRDEEINRAREREHREREREREHREREHREREHREREHREREHREREHREREHREREHREREAKEIRERERERVRVRERTERVNAVQATLGQQAFGREHRLEHQHQPPQTSSSHLSYPMTSTSRMLDNMAGPPPVSAISTSSTMALPQTSTSGTGGLGPTPAPLPTATTTGREGFQSFTGYTTPMPPSPFAITASLPVLPPVVEGGRDSRRQGFPVGGPSFGRDEPTRAEDALRGGLSRQSSGLVEEDRRRRAEKDRDVLMRDRDGPQRMNGSNAGDQTQPKRLGMGMGGMEMVSMTRNWSEDFRKGLVENSREREREEAEKLNLGLGKRERERDEEEATKEKKKKHHHHHNHNHYSHIHTGMVHHHHKTEDDVGAPNLEVPVSRAGARSKSPNSLAHMHHSHMHHPHHAPIVHHHHNPSAAPAALVPLPRIKTSLLIDSSKVVASLSKPRNFLGSIIYHPTPTPKQGYSVTQPLLPRFEGKENSIFQVRIPRRFLSEQQRKEVHRRRCVWGTDIYTDDSDVLGVLVHLGKVPGVMPGDVDPAWVAEVGARRIITNGQTSASPRSPSISSPIKKKVINGTSNGKAEKQQVQDVPTIPASKDLIVDLLILPTLEKYTGSTCNGLKSRSWKTIHDGMSYSIWDMEWVEAGEAEARGGGSKKRRLDEREWVRRWGELPPSRGGMGKNGWGKNRWSVGDGRAGSKGKVAEVGA